MSFVQVIDARSTRYDELAELDTEWQRATEGRRTLRRQVVTRHRSDPDRYAVFCFFDSFSSAMANSELPETQADAERYAALLDGPPTFHDLDVIEERVVDAPAIAAAGFIQVIDMRTQRVAEIQELSRDYEASVTGRSTLRGSLVTRDRNAPDRYVVIAFFDSYDSAMANSALPETAGLAEKLAPLLAGPPVFHDLDVVEAVDL